MREMTFYFKESIKDKCDSRPENGQCFYEEKNNLKLLQNKI